MVAREDRMHESAVNGPPVLGLESRKPLAPLGQRRAAFARPYHGIERQAFDVLGPAFGVNSRPQGTGRDAVDQKPFTALDATNVVARRFQIVCAVGDIAVDVAVLARSAIAFHVDTPGDEAAAHKPIHHGSVGPARDLEIKGRLRRHRRAVNEQNRAARPIRRNGRLAPHEQFDVALFRPMFLAWNRHAASAVEFVHLQPPVKRVSPVNPNYLSDISARYYSSNRCHRPRIVPSYLLYKTKNKSAPLGLHKSRKTIAMAVFGQVMAIFVAAGTIPGFGRIFQSVSLG